MDNKWNIKIKNSSKYNLDTNGLLQITDVTEADNGTEYRCTLQTDLGQESIHIMLILMAEEGIFLKRKPLVHIFHQFLQ